MIIVWACVATPCEISNPRGGFGLEGGGKEPEQASSRPQQAAQAKEWGRRGGGTTQTAGPSLSKRVRNASFLVAKMQVSRAAMRASSAEGAAAELLDRRGERRVRVRREALAAGRARRRVRDGRVRHRLLERAVQLVGESVRRAEGPAARCDDGAWRAAAGGGRVHGEEALVGRAWVSAAAASAARSSAGANALRPGLAAASGMTAATVSARK
jgi:hypothetical protein